jgi:exodeoxyribonuclease V beta subunit
VETLVYRALTTDIPLGAKGSIPGFCRCKQEIREMEFLFPIPERVHPRLDESIEETLAIEHGFVKGFVDLVVEHEGQVYVVDWKSDVLASYEPDAVKKHVDDHYDIQVNLYAVALVKALGIRTEAVYQERFGGMIYVFLRGLRGPTSTGSGVRFVQPSWSAILEYEDSLIELGEQPGGGFR